MAKQRKRTLKRKAGGLESQILSRGKSLSKKALNLGKTIGDEFFKEQLKKQMESAAKSIGKQALNPAINYIPKQIKEEPSRKVVHFRSPPKQRVPMNAPFSPPPTTKPRNSLTVKARKSIPPEGVMTDFVGKTQVKQALKFNGPNFE
jgi:hypothetical protein